jgi:phosphatidylglycerol---prolipoprotein diacylglyceryl transferase
VAPVVDPPATSPRGSHHLGPTRNREVPISLLGGIFGAVALCLPRIRARKLSFWKVMDAAAPAMALGIAVGRTGDLIIGDHLGKVTTFVLGFRCPAVGVETGSPCAPTASLARTADAVVHQTALYDQLLALLILLVLLRLRRTIRFDGFLILVFATGYGLARLGEDFLREGHSAPRTDR